VEAFGGKVCVKEMDALTMQQLMASGAFITLADGTSQLDFSKIRLAEIAANAIVDPETLDPLLTVDDAKALVRKSGFDVIAVVTASMEAAGMQRGEEQPPN
jgi:hypothetical protein